MHFRNYKKIFDENCAKLGFDELKKNTVYKEGMYLKIDGITIMSIESITNIILPLDKKIYFPDLIFRKDDNKFYIKGFIESVITYLKINDYITQILRKMQNIYIYSNFGLVPPEVFLRQKRYYEKIYKFYRALSNEYDKYIDNIFFLYNNLSIDIDDLMYKLSNILFSLNNFRSSFCIKTGLYLGKFKVEFGDGFKLLINKNINDLVDYDNISIFNRQSFYDTLINAYYYY